MSRAKIPAKFSINAVLNKKEEALVEEKADHSEEHLPKNHFTETDLQTEWQKFLDKIKENDIVIFSAINGFRLSKKDEDTILIAYPSESAKSEFTKIQSEFFNHFKHKVNHFRIKTDFVMDVALKKEILTKRKIFDKFAQINPVLKDLDDLLKFDFS